MSHPSPSSVVFEPEYLEGFRQIYEEKIVFNHTLGLKLVSVTPEEVVVVPGGRNVMPRTKPRRTSRKRTFCPGSRPSCPKWSFQ